MARTGVQTVLSYPGARSVASCDMDMVNELVQIVGASRDTSLKYVIEVTPKGFNSKLVDKKGQRGSSFSGSHMGHPDGDYDSLDGQATALILQEARTAMKAER